MLKDKLLKVLIRALDINDKIYSIFGPKESLYYIPAIGVSVLLACIFGDMSYIRVCSIICVLAGMIELNHIVTDKLRKVLKA